MKELVYAVNAAVARALNLSGEHIHNDDVEEGLIVPAAFVFVDYVERTQMLGEKSRQRVHFDIAYLDDTSNRAELLEIIEKLHRGLYLIELPDDCLKRATSLTWDIGEDAVIHAKAVYDIITDIVDEGEKVAVLTQDREIEKG